MVNEVKEERQGQNLIAGVNETSLQKKKDVLMISASTFFLVGKAKR